MAPMSIPADTEPAAPSPLNGQTVLVTRPAQQAHSVVHRLESVGAIPLVQPVVAIESAPDRSQLDQEIERLRTYGGLVFVSTNGVEHWFERIHANRGLLDRQLPDRLVAIGPSTAVAIRRFVDRPVAVPRTSNSEGLAEWLIDHSDSESRPWLIVRGNRGSDVLGEHLKRAGVRYVEVIGYHSVDVVQLDPDVTAQLNAGQVDWVMLTSTAIARSAIELLRPWLTPRCAEPLAASDGSRPVRIASISPTTTVAIRELGMEVAAEAETYSIDGLIDAMQRSAAAW